MATCTPITDLHPNKKERIQRARLETLREQGHYRELVLWLLGCPEEWQPEANGVFQSRAVRAPLTRRIEPTPEDLAGALREESADPLPAPIRDYIITRYLLQTTPRKTGPQRATRSTGDDDRVFSFYVHALIHALDAHEADDSPETRDVKTRAKDRTGKKFSIGPRTIDGIIAARRWLKTPPK